MGMLPDERTTDTFVDDSTRFVCGISISLMAVFSLLINATYVIACNRGRNKFGGHCYYSATRCLAESCVCLAVSQLAVIIPSIILTKWKFDSYQDVWFYEAMCLLHIVADIGIMLFNMLMAVETMFSHAPDRPLFEQRYAMDILCWALYCFCLAHVALATAFQSFHRFYREQYRFYNSYLQDNDISIMIKYFLDWERFVGLSLCFVVFWWKRAKTIKSARTIKRSSINALNPHNGTCDLRKNASPPNVHKKMDPDTITDALLLCILCLVQAAASSILPPIFKFNMVGNIRFFAGVVQTALEALLPGLIPLVHFYANPKARQVLRQTMEEIQFKMPTFRRKSTDSIVILSP